MSYKKANKFLDDIGLSHLWNNIKKKFSTKKETDEKINNLSIEISNKMEENKIIVDSELDINSTNSLQNKVITKELNNLENKLNFKIIISSEEPNNIIADTNSVWIEIK